MPLLYDAVLGKFKKISVKTARLKKYIGKHGPPNGYKDMKLADANTLPGSRDCVCISGYTGDGLNCTATVTTPVCTGVTCPQGQACDPTTGTCEDIEQVIPCIAVIDEWDNFRPGDPNTTWSTFRTNYPTRPFCLLVPFNTGYYDGVL